MRKGLTLFEFLVVAAVISVLAAIALPHILQAQIRSRVARVQNEQQIVASALELYRSDYNAYPPYYVAPAIIYPRIQRLAPLTTPIEYLPSVPEDVFNRIDIGGNKVFIYAERQSYLVARTDLPLQQSLYGSFFEGQLVSAAWIVRSRGPSGRLLMPPFDVSKLYDPTNGTVSVGNIVRWGP